MMPACLKLARLLFLGLVSGLMSINPVLATGSVSCVGIENSGAYVDMVLGAGPVPNILDIGVSDGKRVISTRAGEGVEQAYVAQSYFDGELTRIDMMDDQVTKKLVSVRILRVMGGDREDFQTGYLQIEDAQPIMIRCDGP